MPTKLIGKSVLGDIGFCQMPSKMDPYFEGQHQKILGCLDDNKEVIMTSMTGFEERELTDGKYFPKIREYDSYIHTVFNPRAIYAYCSLGLDKFRPNADFILWNSEFHKIICTTFSREAPILAFESSTGTKCLGTILRKSLMAYGDYLFKTLSDDMDGDITVTLVTCTHYQYPEGSIPDLIQNLASKYGMTCVIPEDSDSEKNPECYHRGESGNHVVALW